MRRLRRALVTGAGGFIGSHLCERLVSGGVEVRALCRYTSRRELGNLAHLRPEDVTEIDVGFGDLRDVDAVRLFASGVDTVFHLAASISVPYSYVAPREVIETNVTGTLNVLTAALDMGVERLVHVSSSEVYGTAQYTPIDESHPLHAQSPYAASKVGADKLAETFHLSFGLPAVVARPFNTYGPRQSLRAVIPTIVAQAVAGRVVRIGSTAPTRDFVFVADTVDALLRLATADGVEGQTFNIATGVDVSVGDVIALVGELLDVELEVQREEMRLRPEQSEVMRLIGNASQLRGATGWSPTTQLRDGLHAVIDWVAAQPATNVDAYAV